MRCMKKLIVCIVLVVCYLTAICQDGVRFEDLTLEQALKKAKAENKLILMDCYTSWCGPCKMMASRIFTQKKAGDFFNSRFVSVKYDMEKGEGIELAKKYNVKSFPTFFIMKPDGTVQHRIGGGAYKLEDFIAWIEMGLNEKTSLAYLEKRYAAGDMTKEEMADYHWALYYAGYKDKDEALKKELWERLDKSDKLQEKFWFLMKEQSYGTSDFKFVVDHIADFRKLDGVQGDLDYFLMINYMRGIRKCLMNEGFKNMKELGKEVKKIRKEVTELVLNDSNVLLRVDLAEATLAGDADRVITILEGAILKAQGNNLWDLLAALDFIVGKGNKEQCERVLVLGEKLIKRWPDERMRANIKQSIDRFRE